MAEPWPPAIAALPRCPVRGLPVPASSGFGPDGAGQFGINDPDAKLACALGELCQVCGRSLTGGPMVFLCIDHGADPARLLFTDPPAHETCAATSMRICPAIAGPGRPGTIKPGWLWLAAGSYELAPGRPPRVRFTFRPHPPFMIRRFRYRGGRLHEVVTPGGQ